jgi:hypothetical protein
VLNANGHALVYVYARETSNEANIAGVLTFDEVRRIAVNVAKLLELLEASKSDRKALAREMANRKPTPFR